MIVKTWFGQVLHWSSKVVKATQEDVGVGGTALYNCQCVGKIDYVYDATVLLARNSRNVRRDSWRCCGGDMAG